MADLRLRKAKLDDCEDLFKWRSDETVRKMSFNSGPLNYEEHVAWFTNALNNTDRHIFIAEDELGCKVGVVRFDEKREHLYEISVNIAPERRGQGWGTRLIREGSAKIREGKGSLEIIARIKDENIASIKAFGKAGYMKINEQDGNVEMNFKGEN